MDTRSPTVLIYVTAKVSVADIQIVTASTTQETAGWLDRGLKVCKNVTGNRGTSGARKTKAVTLLKFTTVQELRVILVKHFFLQAKAKAIHCCILIKIVHVRYLCVSHQSNRKIASR